MDTVLHSPLTLPPAVSEILQCLTPSSNSSLKAESLKKYNYVTIAISIQCTEMAEKRKVTITVIFLHKCLKKKNNNNNKTKQNKTFFF